MRACSLLRWVCGAAVAARSHHASMQRLSRHALLRQLAPPSWRAHALLAAAVAASFWLPLMVHAPIHQRAYRIALPGLAWLLSRRLRRVTAPPPPCLPATPRAWSCCSRPAWPPPPPARRACWAAGRCLAALMQRCRQRAAGWPGASSWVRVLWLCGAPWLLSCVHACALSRRPGCHAALGARVPAALRLPVLRKQHA